MKKSLLILSLVLLSGTMVWFQNCTKKPSGSSTSGSTGDTGGEDTSGDLSGDLSGDTSGDTSGDGRYPCTPTGSGQANLFGTVDGIGDNPRAPGKIVGWVVDTNHVQEPVTVLVYNANTNVYLASMTANQHRSDVLATFGPSGTSSWKFLPAGYDTVGFSSLISTLGIPSGTRVVIKALDTRTCAEVIFDGVNGTKTIP